MRIQTISKL